MRSNTSLLMKSHTLMIIDHNIYGEVLILFFGINESIINIKNMIAFETKLTDSLNNRIWLLCNIDKNKKLHCVAIGKCCVITIGPAIQELIKLKN